MKRSFKTWIRIVCVVLFLVWLGVPLFGQWEADKLVDKLCAEDGGIKVFETVVLPSDRFDKIGNFKMNSFFNLQPGEEYYLNSDRTDIKAKSPLSGYLGLRISKHRFQIFRLKDKKILGEEFIYARFGGDPPGPWFPSSYACPENLNFEASIFLKSQSRK